VIVADDGTLEQRKRILHSLSRCPDALCEFLAVISSGVFLSGMRRL
jgi:hypothetical protein